MKALLALALLSLSPTAAVAKNGTIGIYGIIDQVTFSSPDVVQISGIFVTAKPMSSGAYLPPQRGYLSFRITPDREREARSVCNELKAVAGTGKVVGFTEYWVANPNDRWGNPHHSLEVKVRTAQDDSSPEPYPDDSSRIVSKADERDPDFNKIAAQLRAAASPK
jgi:hypothetical protein